MRHRRLLVVVSAVVAMTGAVAFAVAAGGGVKGSAAETATAYFAAWRRGEVATMARLVHRPPADFAARHRAMGVEIGVESLELRPGQVRGTGEETAEVPFAGTRKLADLGDWPFDGTLRLAVRDGAWKVLWAPETLHPLLKDGGTVALVEIDRPATELVTREGEPIPHNSYAEVFLSRLREEFDEVSAGWELVARAPGRPDRRLLAAEPKVERERTTLSRPVQAAAARALDATPDAAIVAIEASTGEVLAVADRLGGNHSAFHDTFPPGSSFKIVTAAALLGSGLDPAAQVPCPAVYTIPGHRSFQNDGMAERGTLTLADAFAHSCNTTFVQQVTERLGLTALREAAHRWGFGQALPTGAQGTCGSIEDAADPDWLGAAAIGQGTVAASPLCMATIAAAVADGTWRPPRVLSAAGARRVDGDPPEPVTLDGEVVTALRGMMRAVVEYGTAGRRGLPPGVAGKTGTAEVEGTRSHGWFIGFRDDLAFCVFVRHGGAGAASAVPVAARFLNGL